jgi:alpha-D-xyloside xylohydrolase
VNKIKGKVRRRGNELVYTLGAETLVITPWGRDGLRVRAVADVDIHDTPWALTETVEFAPNSSSVTIEISDSEAVIRNGNISARIQDIYTQRGYLQFFRHTDDKATLILCEQDYVVNAHNPGTRIFNLCGDGLFHTEVHFAARDGERFYGMGLNATNRVNLKGCVLDLYQRHVKHTIPFLVSSEGYGFLWNNPSLGRVELGQNMTRWVSYGCRQVDYYVCAGDSYAEIMERYADVTGHAPAFPYWASGFWQCKLRYQTQEEFLGVAREFKRRGLPLAVLAIDFQHWKHIGDWKLDPAFWPDPKAMIREMDEMGVRIMISPWTLVDEQSENFAVMKARGLFTSSIGGSKDTVAFENPPHKYQYDPTNPEAAAFLWSKWKENYFDLGIRTFWLDPCDEFHEIQDYDQVLFHIGLAREAHAFFVVAHQKNIYDGLLSAGEKEVVTICRNSWAGSQRYGASPAAHDIMSSFEHLATYMKAGLNLAMSGIPWGASEIGGFITHDNQSDTFHELMVRWYQYGVFTPVFRTHGYRPNNEAWNIGGDTYSHIRAAMMLRERLRPYIMEQMHTASEKGTPPMRPLFFDFESDPIASDVEDEFLFGPDLLIAPILTYKTRSRSVYLPAGVEWTNAWTDTRHQGGTIISAEAPIEHIPVFVRGNNDRLMGLFKGLYTE